MKEVRDLLRSTLHDSPPIRIDVDRLIDRHERERRHRRLTGTITLALVLVGVSVVGTVFAVQDRGSSPHQPAASASPTASVTASPSVVSSTLPESNPTAGSTPPPQATPSVGATPSAPAGGESAGRTAPAPPPPGSGDLTVSLGTGCRAARIGDNAALKINLRLGWSGAGAFPHSYVRVVPGGEDSLTIQSIGTSPDLTVILPASKRLTTVVSNRTVIILATVDSTRIVPETDESNNAARIVITVPPISTIIGEQSVNCTIR